MLVTRPPASAAVCDVTRSNLRYLQDPSPHEFADYLLGIFASNVNDSRHVSAQRGFHIPAFHHARIENVLCQLPKGKSADSQAVPLEKVCYAPDDL